MPKKCKGRRNALVVTVAAVLLGDIFAGGQNIPAQQTTWNAGETKRTQMTESATQRMDLTDAFAVILQGATKKFIAGYAVDDSFLMWLAARYGDETVVRIASAVLDGTEDPESWYDITGSSIHVLWLMYCRDSGFQQYRLQNVYWKDAGEDGKTVSKCARKNAFSSSGAAKVMQTTLPSSPTCRSGTPLGAQAVQAIACAPELALGQGRDAGHLLERLQE